jgi:hypothetical protein
MKKLFYQFCLLISFIFILYINKVEGKYCFEKDSPCKYCLIACRDKVFGSYE